VVAVVMVAGMVRAAALALALAVEAVHVKQSIREASHA